MKSGLALAAALAVASLGVANASDLPSRKPAASIYTIPLPFGLTIGRRTGGGGGGGGGSGDDCPSCKPVDLAVAKSGGTTPAPVGYYGFTINVTNNGPAFNAPSGSIVITDTAPPNMTFGPVTSPPGWNCSPTTVPPGGVLTCTFLGGTVPAGAVVSISVPGFVPGSGPFPPVTNCAGMGIDPSSGYADSNLGNNAACVTVTKNSPPGAPGKQTDSGNQTYIPPNPGSGYTPGSGDTGSGYTPGSGQWGGFSIGAHFGYASGRSSASGIFTQVTPAPVGPIILPPIITFIPFQTSSSWSTVFGGLDAGYDWRAGFALLGVAADIDLGGGNKTAIWPIGARTSASFRSSARVRAGVAFDRVLAYATVGPALAAFSTNVAAPGMFPTSVSSTRIGVTAGGGLEYALNGSWRAKLEYRYSSFSGPGGGGGLFRGVSSRYTENSVRLGATYSFKITDNGSPIPRDR